MLAGEPSLLPLQSAAPKTVGRRRAWVGYIVAVLLYAGIFDLWQADTLDSDQLLPVPYPAA